MRPRHGWIPALLLVAVLFAPDPAAAGSWRDDGVRAAVDLGDAWSVTTRPETGLSRAVGGAYASFSAGPARGWLLLFGDPDHELASDPSRGKDVLVSVLNTRMEEAGETLLPGTFRAAAFGPARGVLLEYESGPVSGKGRTRIGRAALAVTREYLQVLVAERPAGGTGAADVAELDRFVSSLRVGDPAAKEGAAPGAVAETLELTTGDRLPDADFRSAVEMKPILTLDSGLKVFRQYYLMEGGKLPTYLTHLMGKEYEQNGKKSKTPDLLLLLCNNMKGKEPVKLRAEVEVPGYGEPSSRTITVPAEQSYVATLTPLFTNALYDLTEQRPAAVTLRLYEVLDKQPGVLERLLKRPPGRLIHEETERILLMGRNDFFWFDGTGRSWAPAVATFVTPHDSGRRIDTLLKAAAGLSPFKAIVGYQDVQGLNREQVVVGQMQAVYDAIAAGEFHYINAPFSVDARAQRIKFPGEVLLDGGGNCIETSLVFASAFEAMGMVPLVLIYNDHAQVGVRGWGDDEDFFVLEATMCGSAPFSAALQAGTRSFRQRKAAGETIEVLDIRKLRWIGFSPVPR